MKTLIIALVVMVLVSTDLVYNTVISYSLMHECLIIIICLNIFVFKLNV